MQVLFCEDAALKDGSPSQDKAAPSLCNGVHVRLFGQCSDHLDSVCPAGGDMARVKELVQENKQLAGIHRVRS